MCKTCACSVYFFQQVTCSLIMSACLRQANLCSSWQIALVINEINWSHLFFQITVLLVDHLQNFPLSFVHFFVIVASPSQTFSNQSICLPNFLRSFKVLHLTVFIVLQLLFFSQHPAIITDLCLSSYTARSYIASSSHLLAQLIKPSCNKLVPSQTCQILVAELKGQLAI